MNKEQGKTQNRPVLQLVTKLLTTTLPHYAFGYFGELFWS